MSDANSRNQYVPEILKKGKHLAIIINVFEPYAYISRNEEYNVHKISWVWKNYSPLHNKATLSDVTKKGFSQNKGCFSGPHNRRFVLLKGVFLVQNPQKGVFFKLGYERGCTVWSEMGPGSWWKKFPPAKWTHCVF